MGWSDIGEIVGKAAPLLGSALAGPAGGAAGLLVASALGVDAQPETVREAVQADPQALSRLRRAELEHQRELSALVLKAESARLSDVNATMRVEARAPVERWWVSAWRPLWGALSALAWAAFVVMAGVALLRGRADVLEALGALPGEVWYVPLAILGVASWHRGKEKRIRAGEQERSGLLGGVLSTLNDGRRDG